jgi:hypothetical protein
MNEELNEIYNQEIARELMLEHNSYFTEEVWKLCGDNPWNAGVLYKLLEIKNVS